jgi:hypothetical protein
MSSRAQYGWRSVGEKDAAYADLLAVQKDARWNDTQSIVKAMDRVERSMENPLIRDRGDMICHERDYQVVDQRQNVGPICPWFSGGVTQYEFVPAVNCSIYSRPSSLTESAIRAKGGTLLRRSRPTYPHSNMGQWFGELRDLGRMVDPDLARQFLPSGPYRLGDTVYPRGKGQIQYRKVKGRSNKHPLIRTQQEIAANYVGAQFGWIPFFGDVIKAAEAIANSDKILNQFLRDSGKLVRRSGREVISQNTETKTHTFAGNPYGNPLLYSSYNQYIAGVGVTVNGSAGMFNSNAKLEVQTTVSEETEVRTSALFEYFAYDPEGALPRILSAQQKAQQLLGNSVLSASTLWELVPWSWMSDWFVDIGSLLSYQESVQTDSLVARRGSVVYEQTITILNHMKMRQGSGGPVVGTWIQSHTDRHQKRFPGTPYDMGVSWSGFSTQQWFILGALGISNAPGVPFG